MKMGDTPTHPIDQEPIWIDEAYVTKILNSYTNDKLSEVKSYTKAPATVKGENFVGALYLLSVEYVTKPGTEAQSTSFIIKTRVDNEIMSEIEEEFNMYQREAQFYTAIMPQIYELLNTIDDHTVFGPKSIYVDERIIVLENLRPDGYVHGDVKAGLDFPHCQLILEKLAKFHAATMILYKRNPELFSNHLPGNVSEHPSPHHDLYTNLIKSAIEYCKTQPNLQQYLPKLKTLGEKIIPKMINVFSRNQADRFHVLNHGDMWVNNILFQYDKKGELKTVRFVDYQEGYFGSPGIDWNWFIFSSWKVVVLKNNFTKLLEHYHTTLADLLHKLNYQLRIPTLDDVRKEIVNKGYHGLVTATCFLPILINEQEHLSDPSNFLLNTEEAIENRRIIFNNPKFGLRLEEFFTFFKEHDIL
ncbi:uncharacterized protein LOC119686246 [Teleopsis dalmanni]|uniref:uncharacterized protein LOC119681261 n=1 Tax=Teleopsis dalmanni TaxID=139649 RepID=UPI000D32A883|nr:uncharacterized protein LOC119681261 [Teleopsis dalmanni]XP_037956698.1 uncharacterized protein LOC119686246 [Teleopsis dalmanni]